MRKKLFLLALTAGITATANAQFTVWEDDFNDADISDWTLLDLDANESNWAATGNLQISNEGLIYFGQDYAVLSTYNINFETGDNLPTSEDNWAISPAIDLSYYSGMGQLAFTAQTSIYAASHDLSVYASTSTDQSTFEWVGTVTIVRTPNGSTDLQFSDYTVDISGYLGQPQVYFAFKPMAATFVGYEIDNVSITAENIAGVKDFTKNGITLKQNPVEETLQLQLGDNITTENINITIYNMEGMLVKQAKYNEAGLSVTDLSTGLYLMVAGDGRATEHIKFIKK